MLGQEIVLPLGFWEIVVNYPSVGGGNPPIVRFTYLVTVMTLDWYRIRQKTNNLWNSSGVNFLSHLHFFSSVVSPGQMYGNISRYW